jgi:hypothetical protein
VQNSGSLQIAFYRNLIAMAEALGELWRGRFCWSGAEGWGEARRLRAFPALTQATAAPPGWSSLRALNSLSYEFCAAHPSSLKDIASIVAVEAIRMADAEKRLPLPAAGAAVHPQHSSALLGAAPAGRALASVS